MQEKNREMLECLGTAFKDGSIKIEIIEEFHHDITNKKLTITIDNKMVYNSYF